MESASLVHYHCKVTIVGMKYVVFFMKLKAGGLLLVVCFHIYSIKQTDTISRSDNKDEGNNKEQKKISEDE